MITLMVIVIKNDSDDDRDESIYNDESGDDDVRVDDVGHRGDSDDG